MNKPFISPALAKIYKAQEPKTERDKLARRIREDSFRKGGLKKIKGIFGECDFGCGGYVEEEIEPGEGRFTKIYGCSYLYNGIVDNRIVEKLAPLKRLLLISLPFLPIIILFKKRFLRWFSEIYSVDLLKYELPANKFCKSAREILRVGTKFNIYRDLLYFLIMFWENDQAYRFRGQDIFGLIDKNKLRENPRQEILRVLRIGYRREANVFFYAVDNDKDLGDKWRLLIRVAGFLLLVPKFRRFCRDFLLELDLDKVKLDESDWYFCLRRDGYDFGGLSIEERMKIGEEIDKEKSHIIFGI